MSARSKFEELRRLRSSGDKRSYQAEEAKPVYEKVTEEEFREIAKRAAFEQDFVVDDNGQGYSGNVLEDWDNPSDRSDVSEDDQPAKGKRKRKDKTSAIDKLFQNQQSKPRPQKVAEPIAIPESELLGSIFDQIETNAGASVKKTKKIQPEKKKRQLFTGSVQSMLQSSPRVSQTPAPSTMFESTHQSQVSDHASEIVIDDPMDIPIKQEPIEEPIEEPVIKQVQIKTLQTKPAGVKKYIPKFEREEMESQEPTVISKQVNDNKDWKSVNIPLAEQKEVPSTTTVSDTPKEEDGSMHMFWMDAFEKNGTIYLFGKVWDKTKFVSCCVMVKNMMRNLFVLPRQKVVDDQGRETDQDVTMMDVYQEFDSLRRKHHISQFSSKTVQRKYAFELPNVPVESEYLKVVYPYSDTAVLPDSHGRTFSHIFGTNTRALELFLLKRKMMGPCWIKITDFQTSSTKLSWCRLEVVVENPKSVQVATESKPSPPLVIMSINLRTIMNPHKNTNEVVAVTGLVFDQVNMDSQTVAQEGMQFGAVRQLQDVPMPVGLQDAFKALPSRVDILPNERALLSFLLANIHRYDPDVIVGHNFVDFDLDVLLHRLKFHNVDHWSRVGRLRRTQWPKLQTGAGGTSDSTFGERQVASGRLLCDTYRSAKDLVKSKSYSLTSLAAQFLKIQRPNIEYDKIGSYFWSAEQLTEMMRHCGVDAYLAAQLMFQFQILPLTKQLTNLAGNLWSKTLLGGRAERNEYLLLHEFHDKKFICPDKPVYVNAQEAEIADDDEVTVKTGQGKRKPQYTGGLVLDPKKGFYDKFILMLDFNSLYPSIIQEYNLCFTTVERQQDQEELPNLPSSDIDKGILPKILANLVERRRMVKQLLKDPKISPEEYAQYDIRQKALKLTANSMYGCLGYQKSRFFAKPIAMLITSKGREILQNTVNLAEEMKLQVIYGDTDSIMINTNSLDLNQVKEIGKEFKKAVNKRYKLLEIEMDGFFQRMLLLQKKKYAALVVTEKDGKRIADLETKGLDLVRRDWCGLSHDVSRKVLGEIFSGGNAEQVVDGIHEYLTRVGKEVMDGIIPVQPFIITKSLTKNPEQYADAKTQPHVQVALAMKQQGLSAKVGDIIPYVICEGESSTLAARAHHPDDLVKNGLKIDYQWYLANQIHPPVARLCGPIEGTDNARLAQCLGLDAAKFQTQINNTEVDDVYTFESTIPDHERFKDVDKFKPRCLHCGNENVFESVLEITESDIQSSLLCKGCNQLMPMGSLDCQLKASIRKHLVKYLDQSVICEDPACRTRTKASSVFGRKCLKPQCKGLVQLEYQDGSLYTQLQYYEKMFLLNKQDLEKLSTEQKAKALQILGECELTIDKLSKTVSKYLSVNARRFVDLAQIFSFVQ